MPALSEMDEQFELWWENYNPPYPEDVTVGNFQDAFRAGYEAGYDACRDHWGGLRYSDPCNDFTNGLKR